MVQKLIFAVLVAMTLAAGGLLIVGHFHKNSSTANNSTVAGLEAVNPDYIQIDDQNGARVVATYLPQESDRSTMTIKIELTSQVVDLSGYDFQSKIVLADTNIDPLPTLSSERSSQSRAVVIAKMKFQRDRRSHHHLLVKDLAGIRDRVLHFYL